MRIPASFITRAVAVRGLAVLSLALGAAAVSSSAQAAAWGSLRSPFSFERQLEERMNYAAQVREEQRWGLAFESGSVGYPRKYGAHQRVVCTRALERCAF